MRLHAHFTRNPQVIFLVPTISVSMTREPFINIHNKPAAFVELLFTVRFLCLRGLLALSWEA